VVEQAVSAPREEILRRVRDAIAAAPPAEPPPRAYRREAPAHVDLLCERLADYRADVRRIDGDVVLVVGEALAAHDAKRVAAPARLPADWRPIELVEDDGLTPRELDALDGVVTGCTVAIAETGTLVLTAGPTEGRRVLTLVPDLHVCVVRESQVVALVPEAVTRIAELVRTERRPVTLVSGPSATSDIELSRVEGVHGPRRLVVIVAAD
jgi:L-lactate dehydrogenase complex protein LldG